MSEVELIDADGTVRFRGRQTGGGSQPVGASGVYCFTETFTAAQFAAVYDPELTEAALPFFDLEDGDVLLTWRVAFTETFDEFNSLDFVVEDAGPGSWASPFGNAVNAGVAGDSGPGFVTAGNFGTTESGSLMTAPKTLYARLGAVEAPDTGSVTASVVIARAYPPSS